MTQRPVFTRRVLRVIDAALVASAVVVVAYLFTRILYHHAAPQFLIVCAGTGGYILFFGLILRIKVVRKAQTSIPGAAPVAQKFANGVANTALFIFLALLAVFMVITVLLAVAYSRQG